MPARSGAVSRGRWVLPRGHERVVLALVLAVFGAAIADLVQANQPSLVVLVVVPLCSAIVLRPRTTVTMAVLCTVLAVILPGSLWQDGSLHLVRVFGTAGVALLSVLSAVWRQRLTAVQIELNAERRAVHRDRQEALEVNDTILQDVFAARTWLELGRERQASAALGRALDSTRELVAELLGDRAPRPGQLVREHDSPDEEGAVSGGTSTDAAS